MNKNTRASCRLMTMGLLVATVFFSPGAVLAYRTPDDAQKPAPDFDVRSAQRNSRQVSPVASSTSIDAQNALRAIVPDLTVRFSSLTGVPSRLYSLTRPLTDASTAPARDIALAFLQAQLPLLELAASDIAETRISREFVTQHNGVSHFTVQQQANGIDVFGSVVNINVDGSGRIISLTTELMPGIAASVHVPDPLLSAESAIGLASQAAEVISAGSTRSDGMVYFPLTPGSAVLAWDVTVSDAGSPNVYRTIVNATDGSILWRRNLTYYSHVEAHAPVFTSDSPFPNSPGGTGFAQVPRVDTPFNGLIRFPHADPHADWWNGGPDPARTVTKSNNVFAHNDRDNDNDDSEGYPPAVALEDFTFPLAFPIDQTADPVTYTDAATVQLFYANNVLHDLYYRLGFDEASGNFQVNNFGLGGSGGDPVQADSQDDAASPTGARCNANFSTPGDGSSPRMQMYICPRAGGDIQDGDLDAEVYDHEYTHGVHSRLVPTLTGSQGGMSEGWSDFFAISFLSQAGDNLLQQWKVGRWLFFPGGIRRQPYDYTQAFFTRTYANIVDGSTCTIAVCSNNPSTTCTKDSDCGAGNTCNSKACSFDFQCQPPATTIPQGTCAAEVHNTGELWAETLWIARANMVFKYGFTTGGLTMLQDVIDGMKLSAPAPDFLDMRDAILLADQTDNAGVNQCLLWNAFARMGLGVSALTTGPDDINPIEAFDTPSICTPNIQVSGPTDFGDVCLGSAKDNQLEVFNTGTGDLIVTGISRVSGSAQVTLEASNPTLPATISADAHLDFNVRCEPSSFGPHTATFRITSTDPDQPQFDVVYTCNTPQPNVATLIADNGNFGDVCRGSFKDLPLTINNNGGCNLFVANVSSTSADFVVAGTSSFPLTVAPGTSIVVQIRLAPTTLGAKSGTIHISSNDPDTPTKDVAVSGNVPPGDIRVTGSAAFGDVCAETTGEKPIQVCNVGKCNLNVASVALNAGCTDFTLVNNPFPAAVSHDSCLGVVVRFTPTSCGAKACTLTITSDDPDTPIVTIPVTANTPCPSIDVPGDLPFPPTVIQSVGACSTALPFPVSNTGTCNLKITNFAITDHPDEYALQSLPSNPIILEPGHIAGEGDLDILFTPAVLDRDRTGAVSVTYETDPFTHASATVTSALCGEGVRTGARVLVKAGGIPLASVERIHLQRINANRNGNLLDTVDVVRNAPLQTVTPALPCGPFQFHREYGTVSNPIQLLPGSFQVTVTAIVNGRRVKKTVGFDVNTCTFNPTIVVDF